jgi:saccharopine dehydrogenase-like NADP-dependent oxidoreductase
MSKPRILVLGGYGIFGKRICQILADDPNLQIIVGGRDQKKAEKLIEKIKTEIPDADIIPFQIDWQSQDFEQKLKACQANILIHSAGPFQGQDYKVAHACIDAKIHYIDLSDGRAFVSEIKQLDEKAKAQGVIVISGASSVPGLSSVVVDKFAEKFGILREIDCGIAPANQIERGNATISAILGYTGKPFQRLENGEWKTVYGWQNLHKHYYGDNLGLRWHGNCDIPDLILFPERYPLVKTVVFHAGLEVTLLHLILWNMSWLSRIKLIKNWSFFIKPIVFMSNLFNRFGTDAGGMYIRMYGSSQKYQPLEVVWTLVAEKGQGPYIPTVASVILTKKILKGEITPGARPCLGMFSLDEFDDVISKWEIYHTVEETES